MYGICSTSRCQDNIKMLPKKRKLAVIIYVSLNCACCATVFAIKSACFNLNSGVGVFLFHFFSVTTPYEECS